MISALQISARLEDIWREILGTPNVDPAADFFALGGTSLRAVDLAAAVQEQLALRLDAVEVVLNPTLGQLSALLVERLPGAAT